MIAKIKKILVLSSIAPVLYGCGNSNQEIMKLVEERDSLRQAQILQKEKLDNYSKTIETLNATLDSIAYQEKMIFVIMLLLKVH